MGSSGNPRRFSVLCPNNPEYREFVVAQLSELCDRYDFEGVWPDMAFWPTVCFCPSCRGRYAEEVPLRREPVRRNPDGTPYA